MNHDTALYMLLFGAFVVAWTSYGLISYVSTLRRHRGDSGHRYYDVARKVDIGIRGNPWVNLIFGVGFAGVGVFLIFQGVSHWGHREQRFIFQLLSGLCTLAMGLYVIMNYREYARETARGLERLYDFWERHLWIGVVGAIIGFLGGIVMISQSLSWLLR